MPNSFFLTAVMVAEQSYRYWIVELDGSSDLKLGQIVVMKPFPSVSKLVEDLKKNFSSDKIHFGELRRCVKTISSGYTIKVCEESASRMKSGPRRRL
jgi:hypothetical protein